jgi:16S rRNA (guanine527-N7)-methyltransferase
VNPSECDPTELLRRYAEEVRACPHNLMSRAGLLELDGRHIPESVRFAARLPRDAKVVDIGSGGGLPGLVIAIVRPDLDVHLVESTGKKADFLSTTAAKLEIRATVHHARVEDVAKGELSAQFDVVTARAVAALRKLVDLAVPLLKPDGALYAIKGSQWEAELTDSQERIEHHRLAVLDRPGSPGEEGEGPLVVILGRPSDAAETSV